MVGEAMASSVKWVRQFGGIVRFYHLFGYERVLVADPEALRHMLVTHVHKYRRRPTFSRLLGSGIFTVSAGEEHTFQRRLINPFFNQSAIQSYMSVFERNCQKLIKLWEHKITSDQSFGVICVQDTLMRMALDIVGQAVFSFDFRALDDEAGGATNEYEAFSRLTSQPNISFIRLIPFVNKFPTRARRQLDKSFNILDHAIYAIIDKKRNELALEKDSNEHRAASSDLLGKMILAEDEETGSRFNDRQLRDQVMSLLVAGHETTGSTMSWILMLLATHPDVQRKVREEVMTSVPSGDHLLQWSDIEKLSYLTAVIKEAQRLYPAAPSVYRQVVEDDVMKGYFLPKGTIVCYHVGALMRNPQIWDNPDEFRPERFLDPEATKIQTYAYLPFVTGAYKCLGHQFAKMQMKVVLVRLLQKFEFKKPNGLVFKRKMRLILKADPPVTLEVTPVSNRN